MPAHCECRFEQDSKLVPGLQLADLIAHTCSMMLLEKLGLITKLIKVGPNSGYDPDLQVELGWALWASVRYAFFHGGSKYGIDDDPVDFMTVDVAGYGLFIDKSCDPRVAAAALNLFGKCYLGCIH